MFAKILGLFISIATLFWGAPVASGQWNSDDFTQRVNLFLAQHNLPGMVLIIKKDGQDVHRAAYGKVNVKSGPAMAEDAIFRLFSMSKPITAVAVLQLVERGLISLDDDVRQHLPGFDPFEFDGEPQVMTVHQLLAHTSGLDYGGGIDSWNGIRFLLANPLSRSNTLADMVDDISGIGLKFIPGERWSYSVASDVQGALVEAVSGMTLDTYFQQNIFAPLGMTDTGFYVPKAKAHRLVDHYIYDAEGIEALKIFDASEISLEERGAKSDYLEKPNLLSGGGGLVSTAEDYSRFVDMLMNKGVYQDQRVLSEDMIAAMLTSHTRGLDTWFLPLIYNQTGFGYGLGVKEESGDPRGKGSFYWAGMGGTVFWGDPQNGVSVVAMMQVEDGWVALERWLIPEIYGRLRATHPAN